MNTFTPMIDFKLTKQYVDFSSGDFALLGEVLKTVGGTLADSLSIQPGQKVLDISAGSAKFALAAAHRSADVISTDALASPFKPDNLLAKAQGLDIAFQPVDLEQLPFDDNRFDQVGLIFGVVVTAKPAQMVRELLRVCRKGGKIGLISWNPDSFVGGLFKPMDRAAPAPANLSFSDILRPRSQFEGLFEKEGANVRVSDMHCVVRYRSADHWTEMYETYFGAVHEAPGSPQADTELQNWNRRDIVDFMARENVAADRTTVACKYQEIIISKS